MEHPEFIAKIDWELLREQKKNLINACKRCYNLNGILYLIDELQDYAVDVMGIDEDTVFNLKEDE